MSVEFKDFIANTEEEYKKNSDSNNIQEYFKSLCKRNKSLNDEFQNFCKDHKKGNRDVETAFIKSIILENIMPNDEDACIVRTGEHKGHYKISKIKNSDFFFTAISYPDSIKQAIQSGKFSMDASKKSIWLNFCAAFNKKYTLFNDWNKINEFLTKCCISKKSDNFLYARNLKNVCAYFTILHRQSNQDSDKLYKRAINEVKNKQSKLRKENKIITACYTKEMQHNLIEKINKNMSEDEFISLIGENSNEFLGSNNSKNMTAIKKICKVLHPFNEDEDYGGRIINSAADMLIRFDRIADIYYPLFDELDFLNLKKIIKNCKQLSDNDLRVIFLNKILPNFKYMDNENITAQSYWDMQKQKAQKQIKTADDNTPKNENKEVQKSSLAWLKNMRPILNRSIRYIGVIAAMLDVDEDNKSAGAAIESINAFLNECCLRELDQNDVFDWFVIKCVNYEETLQNYGQMQGPTNGLTTFIKYLTSERVLEVEPTMQL